MNNYLVIFSSHVDNEDKKNNTIETLKHLKELNIDVCLSTHSNLYLDELSQYTRYVIYDSDNEFLILQDYIDNCKSIDDAPKYGFTSSKIFHNFGYVSINIPGSPHSKCALSLLRNGITLSELNNYKWTIYLEYDIKIPKLGFKNFFDFHIDRLVESNKKCFHYKVENNSLNFLWGGPFIFETQSFFGNEKFMKNDWHSSNQNWIKEWGAGFFESIIKYTIDSVFDENEIITEIIQDKYKNFWEADDLSQIDKFKYEETFYGKNRYSRRRLEIYLYPNINKEGNEKLYLYYYNSGNTEIILNKILVYSDSLLHINKKDSVLSPGNWFLLPIEIDKLTETDTVILNWSGSIEDEYYSGTQSIKIGDLGDIQRNVMSINFN